MLGQWDQTGWTSRKMKKEKMIQREITNFIQYDTE